MPEICGVCTLGDFLQEEVLVEGDACTSPLVRGARRVGDVGGSVSLSDMPTSSALSEPTLSPSFQRSETDEGHVQPHSSISADL